MTTTEKVQQIKSKLLALVNSVKDTQPQNVIISAMAEMLLETGITESEALLLSAAVYREATTEIDLYQYQTEKVQDNWNPDKCCLCGKPVGNSPAYVHYLTNGNITSIASEDDVPNSQGCFPIGVECKKKLPKGFVFEPNPAIKF